MKFSIFLALLPVSRFSSKNDPNYTLLETLQLKTYTLFASTMTEKKHTPKSSYKNAFTITFSLLSTSRFPRSL